MAVLQDFQHAVRLLRKSPGFTGIAVLTLALGIGANTALFSVLRAVLFQPLPYKDSDQLVLLWNRFAQTGLQKVPISLLDIPKFRDEASMFEDFAGIAKVTDGALIVGGEAAQHVSVGRITANFFPLLGVPPQLGRELRADDVLLPLQAAAEGRDLPPISVVLSHALWQRSFGGDPEVIGRLLQLNGLASTVVGVMPSGFELYMPPDTGMARQIDLWAPLFLRASDRPRELRDEDSDEAGAVIGRLKAGVTLEQARAEMEAIASRQRQEVLFHKTAGTRIDVFAMRADVVSKARPLLVALAGAVGFVLLVACINVANLLLARAAGRRQEIALRCALGAGRFRIAAQLLTENAVLALLGAALGLALARLGIKILDVIRPADLPRAGEVRMDGGVLLFTLVVALVATLIFGLIPAVSEALRRSDEIYRDRSGVGGRGMRLVRNVLVVAEVALSLVLLIAAGLMLRTAASLQSVRPGFEPQGVLVFQLSLRDPIRYRSPRQRNEFIQQMHERLSALPGVEAVGLVSRLPLSGRISTREYGLAKQDEASWSTNNANFRAISYDYFQSLGTRVIAGRAFTPADDSEDHRVVIVDRRMASRIAPDGRAVGHRLGLPLDGKRVWAEVVGVVENIRYETLREDGRETLYVPYRHEASRDVALTLKTRQEPAALLPQIREVMKALDPQLPVYGLQTLESYLSAALAPTRFTLVLLAVFAVVALMLASVGLYGVVSYSVAQRTREFGIRLILGAEVGHLRWNVVRSGMVLTAMGLGIGLVSSAAASQVLRGLLYGVAPTDALTYTLVCGVLALVALFASYLPARRASRVHPAEALRDAG